MTTTFTASNEKQPTANAALDMNALNALLGRFVTDMGAAMQAPLLLLGEELGLYPALAEGPASSAELARRVGCVERYVREWVRSLAAAGYVTYHADEDVYSLSPEQAMLFDPKSPAFVLGGFEVALAAAGSRQRLTQAFRSGAGIGWHEHDEHVSCGTARFFGGSYRGNLVSSWIPALAGVQAKLHKGARIVDVGCGHGISTLLMAEAFPRSTVLGIDTHPASLAHAAKEARRKGLSNARFEHGVASDFPGEGYDLVTIFDALHDFGDPVAAARHIRRALAPDGVWMIVEPRAGDQVSENLNPVGRAFYSASTILCVPNAVSQGGRRTLGAQAGAKELFAVLAEAGFSRVRRATETPFNLVIEARA